MMTACTTLQGKSSSSGVDADPESRRSPAQYCSCKSTSIDGLQNSPGVERHCSCSQPKSISTRSLATAACCAEAGVFRPLPQRKLSRGAGMRHCRHVAPWRYGHSTPSWAHIATLAMARVAGCVCGDVSHSSKSRKVVLKRGELTSSSSARARTYSATAYQTLAYSQEHS
jgi:hypothetical protein